MKLFWRPTHVSPTLLSLVAALAVAGYLLVETVRVERPQPDYQLKIDAAKVCDSAFEVIKNARVALNPKFNDETDPLHSGLIGPTVSYITSKAGNLEAKQTTVNPNWAAVFIALFKKARIEEGDTVAFGVSGSFPALNIAALSAAKVMGLRPLIITSVSASTWGANNEQFTWLDMEAELRAKGIFDFKSIAATKGGLDDRGGGITRDGKEKIIEAMRRNQVEELVGKKREELVDARIEAYEKAAAGAAIVAYVNIGGGLASVGSVKAKNAFGAGVNDRAPTGDAEDAVGVMQSFAKKGVPVVHVSRIRVLAEKWGLPWTPQSMPKPGEGQVYRKKVYDTWLVWVVLCGILASLVAITRIDVNFVLRKVFRAGGAYPAQPPGPSV